MTTRVTAIALAAAISAGAIAAPAQATWFNWGSIIDKKSNFCIIKCSGSSTSSSSSSGGTTSGGGGSTSTSGGSTGSTGGTPVPEPGSLGLLAAGVVGLGLARRRQRRQR